MKSQDEVIPSSYLGFTEHFVRTSCKTQVWQGNEFIKVCAQPENEYSEQT